MQITVLGSGGWGTALAVMLAQQAHEVTLWSRTPEACAQLARDRENKKRLPGVALPEALRLSSDIACACAPMVVCAPPSVGVEETLLAAAPHIPRGAVVVSVSKGFIPSGDRYLRISEAVRTLVSQAEPVALTGPSHAEEVGLRMPTACVAASESRAAAELTQEAFMNSAFRVYTTPDLVGAELGGALKNIIALAAGVCDGMGLGDNTKAALMTRGLTEMARLGVAMGGHSETFAGLAGIGDLIVTCTSMHSRNRRAGILIGQGLTPGDAIREVGATVEGYWATQATCSLSRQYGVEMPIAEAARAVLYGGKPPAEAIGELMGRGKKHETEEIWMRDIHWPDE